jgi:hypothetical protein
MAREQIMHPPGTRDAGPPRRRVLRVVFGAAWYLANLGGLFALFLTGVIG